MKKIITISGYNNLEFNDDMNLYNSFYIEDNQLAKIKDYCQEIISMYFDNDLYIPIEDALNFVNQVSSNKILIKNAGHFNEKSGYTEFRELLKYL